MGEKNNRKCFVCNGASNHSNVAREINDFYATPSIATKTFVEYLDENYPEIKKMLYGSQHVEKAIFQKFSVRLVIQ